MMLYICNQSQHIWEQFQFSCEVAQCGKTLVSVFQEFFPGISGFFNLAGGLGAGLSFYGVWALS